MSKHRFADTRELSKWVIRFAYFNAAIAAVGLWATFMEIQVFQQMIDGALTSDFAIAVAEEESAARQLQVGIASILVFLVSIVLFLRWTLLSARNVRALGSEAMKISPAWSVGWYFIPFANLVKPLQAVKEIWQATEEPDDPTRSTPPAIINTWWSLWVLMGLVYQASFRIYMNSETAEGYRNSSYVDLIGGGLDIGASFALVAVVTQITALQWNRATAMRGHMASTPAID